MIQRRKQLSGQLLTMVKERSKADAILKDIFDDTHELDANSIVVKTLHIMKRNACNRRRC